MSHKGRRAALIADGRLGPHELRTALSDETDRFLTALFVDALGSAAPDGPVSLLAVGGYGSGALCPGSDLDVLLLHDGLSDPETLARGVFYPVWDAGLKLGHAVRTPSEARALAAEDIETATALLQLRRLAGDAPLASGLSADVRRDWTSLGSGAWTSLERAWSERHRGSDEIAFMLEPDLKDGRGGLRDIQVAQWAELAAPVLAPGDAAVLAAAADTLLDVRATLHRVSGSASNVLTLEQQDPVAAAIAPAGEPFDADALMSQVAGAAREAAWIVGDAMARATAESSRRGRLGRILTRRRSSAAPVDAAAVEGGLVVLSGDARVSDDPFLALDVAHAAAANGARIDRSALDALARDLPSMPERWSDADRDRLIRLLAMGRPAIAAIEALEHHGLFSRMIPEWEPNRSRPQRNAYHRFTVDRHLLETAAVAAELTDAVRRPDLLLLGALFHDIGKGFPGDHTVVGMELVRTIGPRMGLASDDVDHLEALVEHHLLLPDVATRRDLDDDGTIRSVAAAVGSTIRLELLDALTEADSRSTGPSAWSAWKADLIRTLVTRSAHVLDGGSVMEATAEPRFPTSEQRAILSEGRHGVTLDGDRLTVATQDRPGVFSRVAGALAISGLDVLGAAALSEAGTAISEWTVCPVHGGEIDAQRLEQQVLDSLAGRLAVSARVAERTRTYGRPKRTTPTHRLEVQFDNDMSDRSTVVQVTAPDCPGILYRITRALAQMDCDISSAKVQTLGSEVVDSFYVTSADGSPIVDRAHLSEIERSLLHAIAEALADAAES